MKADVKKLWIDALRSGEYKRGTNALRTDDKFCCLGVLCDLHSKVMTKNKWTGGQDHMKYAGENGSLPDRVMRWAGLWTNDPMIGEATLSYINDRRFNGRLAFTQKQIADKIEKYL